MGSGWVRRRVRGYCALLLTFAGLPPKCPKRVLARRFSFPTGTRQTEANTPRRRGRVKVQVPTRRPAEKERRDGTRAGDRSFRRALHVSGSISDPCCIACETRLCRNRRVRKDPPSSAGCITQISNTSARFQSAPLPTAPLVASAVTTARNSVPRRPAASKSCDRNDVKPHCRLFTAPTLSERSPQGRLGPMRTCAGVTCCSRRLAPRTTSAADKDITRTAVGSRSIRPDASVFCFW